MAVRQIHELICAGQETYRVVTSIGWQDRPLPKGRYKDDPNNPISRLTGQEHAHAPPIDEPTEMGRLVLQFRSEASRRFGTGCSARTGSRSRSSTGLPVPCG